MLLDQVLHLVLVDLDVSAKIIFIFFVLRGHIVRVRVLPAHTMSVENRIMWWQYLRRSSIILQQVAVILQFHVVYADRLGLAVARFKELYRLVPN